MRKDVYERMRQMKKEGIKPNYAEISRMMNCDWRTAKKQYETLDVDKEYQRPPKPSKLDPYKEIIREKVEEKCTAASIYQFIKRKGFTGGYTIVKDCCAKCKDEGVKKATIRFETVPGLQGQVDWKEELKMISRHDEVFVINLFLIVLGYSRKKFWKLTLDRSQDTLIRAMIDSFRYYGGVPKEILFDNMKTVIDQSKSNYKDVVINELFYQFSKDMGFEVISCRPFRPQTKGKVENLAKFTSRMMPYNHEFDDIDELNRIVREINEDINNEISQATGEVPNERFLKEKEYLLPLPNNDLINEYLSKPITRIVTKESMVVYMNNKYSVDTQYIGKTVTLSIEQEYLNIIYKDKIITTHKISGKRFNYQKEHMKKILKSDAFRFKSDDELEKIAEQNLKLYDKL